MNEFTGERVIPGQVEIDLWNEHRARYVFARRFTAGKRVLDIGCGSGYGTAELAHTAQSVDGIDIAPDAVAYARAQFPALNLQFTAASAAALPFAAGSFDVITCFEVIEHLENWKELLLEARRVLDEHGLLLISTPNKSYYTESRGSEGANPYHVHEFEADEFRRELSTVFPNTTLLMQNRSEAFIFHAEKVFAGGEAHIECGAGSEDTAHIFVAVCSIAAPTEPGAFVYVPRAANVLREREQHIAKLQHELALNQRWLEETRTERAQLQEHLEGQNRWALDLEQRWRAAGRRVVTLQDEYAELQKAAAEQAARYESRIAELENWGRETEGRLTSEIEQFRTQLSETVRLLEQADATVEERTRWALDTNARLEKAEALLAAARASRWVRAGRLFGAGPAL